MKFKILLIIAVVQFISSECLSQTDFNAIQVQSQLDDTKSEVFKISDLVRASETRVKTFGLPNKARGELVMVSADDFTIMRKNVETSFSFEKTDRLYEWKKTRETVAYSLLAAETIVYIIGVAGTEDSGLFGNIEGAAYTAVYLLSVIPPIALLTTQRKHKSNKWSYTPVYIE